jgi:signal transduction histidine kinase
MKMSIRYQILALLSSLLVIAIVSHLFLANRLFTQDKLAYIYDLERSLTATVSQEVRASVGSLVDKLGYFAEEQARRNGEAALAPLLSSDPDLLSVEIWEQTAPGRLVRVYKHIDPARLAAANVSEDDLIESRRTTPIPLGVVASEGVILQNSSLAPDIALLTLAAPVSNGRRIVMATMRPTRLLRVFGRTDAYRVYLVDGKGGIVVHPDANRVIRRDDVSSVPIVREAIQSPLPQVHEFEGPGGAIIGAFAPVGLGRLVVVAEVPRAEALRASVQLVRRSVLFGLGILFLGLIATIYFTRWLTAPLRVLEEATAAVGRGEFHAGVVVKAHNEIGRLAAAFNRMGQELADREARLSEAHRQLMESEKLSILGELSASIAHEVKNPLAGIVGYAQLGMTSQDLGQTKEHLEVIERHAWRASRILEGLLDFARVESLDLRPLDLSVVTADGVRLVAHQVQSKRVALETDLPEGLPPILGNANQLQQVLLNLIMNGVQALEGCPVRTIRVRVRQDGDAVVLSVQDTGAGIPLDLQPRLFMPFFTTKPKGKGTGLGLSVSQRIVNRHRGELRFESTPGMGSVFSARFPTAAAVEARKQPPASPPS